MINTEKFSISIPKELNKTLLNVAEKQDRSRNYLIVKACEICYGGAALKGSKKINVLTESYNELIQSKLSENPEISTYEVPATGEGEIDMSKLKHIAKELKSPNKKKGVIKSKVNNAAPKVHPTKKVKVLTDVADAYGKEMQQKNNAAPKKESLAEKLAKL